MTMAAPQLPNETPVWEGSPAQITNLGLYVLCGLLCFLIVPLFIALWRWMVTRCTRYELTSQRIFLSTGVLSKKTEVLELYRVRDLDFEQPFFLRLFKLGNINLRTSDLTSPQFVFHAVREPRALSDQIRKNVEACRVAKGTRELDLADQNSAIS
jgi:uncharacterized membrane protein YdbT with pleckstrin-like domain